MPPHHLTKEHVPKMYTSFPFQDGNKESRKGCDDDYETGEWQYIRQCQTKFRFKICIQIGTFNFPLSLFYTQDAAK